MKGKRLIVSSSLTLALTVSAAAAVVSAVPEAALAPLGVPALIFGGPANMPAVLARALAAQTALMASLPAPEVAPHLITLAASQIPVERASAKLLAHFLVAPPGAPAAAEPGLLQLADAAKSDPAFAAWSFDGKPAARPSLELDGLTWEPGREWAAGSWRAAGNAPLKRLGQGKFGFVDAHPTVAGAALKTVAYTLHADLNSTLTPEETSAQEEEIAHLLSAADAGPRHLGRAIVEGQLVSVRERVYGDTLASLFDDRNFGPAERNLVLNLLRRMAAAGVMIEDLSPLNVMIGRTLLDPRRRAYVVDGGSRIALSEGLDVEARFRYLLHEPVVSLRTLAQVLDYGRIFWSEAALRERLARGIRKIWKRLLP